MINDLKNPQFRKGKSKSYVFNIVKTAMASIGAGGDAILSLFSGLLASALILYSGYVLYDTFYVQNNAYSAWDVLREYKPDLSGLDDGLVPGETWETMQEIVKDYRSWITVYDTTIDYPVVQGEDDLYYARNDIYGNPSLTGAIYLAADNAGDFSENYSLIYGHHMDNGAMFGALDKYAENEYFQNHREGILITRDKIYDFKFFATLNTDAYDDKIYIVGGDKNLKELLAYIKENAVLYDEAAAKGTTKILALSTCVSALTNGRLVVFANLKERKTGDERIYIEPTIIEDNPRDAGPADGGYTYYDVLFFKDLGDTDVYAYERVRSDSKAVPPDAPEKEGYTFAYWGDEHGNRFDFDSRVMADSDLYAYYDINQYNVRYYNEDGSSVLFTRQVDYNNFAENIEIPAKDGYYAYWSETEDGSTEFDFTKPIKDETKLYVVYKPVSEIDYTVKYYDENGKLIEQKTVGADQGFKAEDLDITAIYGYDSYWSATPGGEPFDMNTVLDGDISLYIVYKPIQYTVTYYNEDGSEVVDTITVNFGNKTEKLEIPEKDGYYAYWSTTPDGNTEFDFTKPVDGEVDLYIVYKAIPEEDYTVSYYDENGKLIEEKTVGLDQGFKAENLDIPGIEGYDSYWSRTPDGKPFDMNTVLDGDIELYRVYKPISEEYTVTYYNEDGSKVVETMTVNAGGTAEKLEIPEKDGYYAYWSTTPDGNTEYNFTKPVDGEVNLYIVYKAIPEEDYTVSYYDENGKLIEEKTVGIEEGFKAENLIIPERKGYYAYWSTSPDGDPFDMNTVLDGDISLYIVYKPVNDKGTQGGSGSTSGGNGSGTSGGDGGDGGEGGENNPDDGGESTNPFEELINYFKPTGTSYNANGRPAWALVNLISMIITIYILFPIMHMKAKYGRGNLMKRINKQKKDLWEANALFEREEDVREGIRKQALENRKKENEDADKALVIPPITEEEFDEAVEDLYYKVKKFLIRFRTGITMETIVSVVAVITFLLTEDIRLPMVLIDRWTPLMLLFLLGCWLTDVILARYRRNTEAIEDNLPPKQDENSGENAESETKTH